MVEAVSQAVALGTLWLLLAAVASLVAAAGLPVLRRLLRGVGAEERARALLTYGLLPPTAAALVVLLSLFPEATLGLVPDHCHGADCAPHAPRITVASPSGALLVAIGALVAVLLGTAAGRTLGRVRRSLRVLDQLAEPDDRDAYRVVDTARPLAWCTGLLRPRVFLSRGLLARLTEEETRAVLAHEHAHARRRDNLLATVLRYATLPWPRGVRRRLLADLAVSIEVACDREAVASLGSSEAVARLLQSLEGTGSGTGTDAHRACASVAIASRLGALRAADTAPRPADYAWLWAAVLWSVLVVGLVPLGHRSIEWLTAA